MVVITLEEGKIRGKEAVGLNGVGFYSFQGIPYAKPPLGELRFKAPRPVEKWSDIKDCTKEGPSAYSRHMIYQNIIGSEDCLILNVYTKSQPQESSNKPVMVWIHGGGFTLGSSNLYGPDFFMTKDIVLVTINYRLGVFGFMAFDDPELGIPGNTGLKDQVMALEWVQRNIKYFGGDPKNVTIFGESAGGASVHYLILSPMTKGLFHKAIFQSGCALCPWSIANNPLKKLLDNLNCPFKNEKDVLKYLQSLPAQTLLEAHDKLGDNLDMNGRRDFGLIIEKPSKIEPNFLCELPIQILKKGTFNKVPIMLGYTSGEGFLAKVYNQMYPDVKISINNFESAIPKDFNVPVGSEQSKRIAEKIKGFYFGEDTSPETNSEKFYLLEGDVYFLYGIHLSAEEHLKMSKESVYLYRFSYEGKRNLYKSMSKLNLPGACHGDELAYLFHMDFPELLNDNKILLNSKDDITIHRMIELWTNFATTGNPNPLNPNDFIDVSWKPINSEEINFIDIGTKLTVGTNPDGNRMAFWKDIHKSVQ